MGDIISTEIHLAARPEGWPTDADFRTVTHTYGDLTPGKIRVANEFVSVDPYMRGRMNDVRSYVPPFELGQRITGAAVGRVTDSASEDIAEGELVLHQHGWSDVIQEDASTFRVVPDVPGLSPSLRLHIFGMTGLTAYVGLTEIAGLAEGETVFVSGAAGAVGTAAGQIAALLGAGRVVGSAGTAEKVALLTEKYGYDAAFNYKDGDTREQLLEVAPEGIDVYFDNVGGDHLEAAIAVFNDGGRAALCGAISGYNATEPAPGPDNMMNLITRGLTLRGFTLGGHLHLASEFDERMTGWFSEGRIAYDETVVDGIENVVGAFLGMMRGENVGKMLVRVGGAGQ
ncbi:NADP-dependent oxidoreductase [Ruania suaedae]|uniref:NADP-dependent oxidoreductase n=1 Tax=Ruania suaedae TaxID=2897774 RepID=UPI001E3C4C84|nr:NADP-dependent oxidoreductase [Ruania suaedae]UFU04478.1 NADP-dependent oxidoreductase [Ruania suaedae]